MRIKIMAKGSLAAYRTVLKAQLLLQTSRLFYSMNYKRLHFSQHLFGRLIT
jgi:hypothetical protein